MLQSNFAKAGRLQPDHIVIGGRMLALDDIFE
jgi:hypothetical protein